MTLIESLTSESERDQLRQMMDKILQVDIDVVRFVGILNTKENCLMTKMQHGKTSVLSQAEEEIWALKLKNMKAMQAEFDHALGKVSLMRIRRERLTQLVFFVSNLIIFVAVEPLVSQLSIDKISNDIEIIIQHSC